MVNFPLTFYFHENFSPCALNGDDVASQSFLPDWLLFTRENSTTNQRRYTDHYRVTSSQWNVSGCARVNSKYTKQRDICFFLLPITVALEVSEVSLNLVPLKCLIQGSACQVLKKTDMAVKVGTI